MLNATWKREYLSGIESFLQPQYVRTSYFGRTSLTAGRGAMEYPYQLRVWTVLFCLVVSLACLTAAPATSDHASIRNATITQYDNYDLALHFDNQFGSPPTSSDHIRASLIDNHIPSFETFGYPRRGERATVTSAATLSPFKSISFWADYSLGPRMRLELWQYKDPWWSSTPGWSLAWWTSGTASNSWVSVHTPGASQWQFSVVAVPELSAMFDLAAGCTMLAGFSIRRRRV